jgi:porin
VKPGHRSSFRGTACKDRGANLFVNSTFGWPVINAQDLPSGGPAYPEATPGARVQYSPNDNVTILAAIFNGDPAGPGPGNPVQRDPFGLAFRIQDPPFLIAEVDYSYGQKQASGNYNQEGSMPRAVPSDGKVSEPLRAIKLGAWVELLIGEFAGVHTARLAATRLELTCGRSIGTRTLR